LRVNSNRDERVAAGVLANAVKLAVAFQGHPIPSIEIEGYNLPPMFQRTDSVVELNGNGARNLISLAGAQRVCDPADVAAIGVRRSTSTGRASAVSEREARVIEQRHFT